MGGVKRYNFFCSTDVSQEGRNADFVLASDFDAALAREAALREELAQAAHMRTFWAESAAELDKRLTAAEQPAPVAVVLPDLSELREYHSKAISNLKSYADDEGLRDSDVKHYTKRADFHAAMVELIDKVKELNNG